MTPHGTDHGTPEARDGSDTIRVATWNLQRASVRSARAPGILARLAAVDADIWVLTETDDTLALGDGWHTAPAPPLAAHRRARPTERKVAVWSRWPLTVIEDPPPHWRGSAAALVHSDAGDVVVYGAVVPYAGDGDNPDGLWSSHLAHLDRQRGEWQQLRRRFDDLPLVVAGDFNCHFDGSRRYGPAHVVDRHGAARRAAGLTLLTGEDVTVTRGIDKHLVDHIAVSHDLDAAIEVLSRFDGDGVALSDHPTVVADLLL